MNFLFFKINFFLYAITGKAFRHELKRLFRSIAVKMHLTKQIVQPPMDRRFMGTSIKHQMSDNTIGQRRVSTAATIQLLRYRSSIDSCASNGAVIKHHH